MAKAVPESLKVVVLCETRERSSVSLLCLYLAREEDSLSRADSGLLEWVMTPHLEGQSRYHRVSWVLRTRGSRVA